MRKKGWILDTFEDLEMIFVPINSGKFSEVKDECNCVLNMREMLKMFYDSGEKKF